MLTGRRSLDVALVGGISLCAWLVGLVVKGTPHPADGSDTSAGGIAILLAVTLVNAPHFMASYRLAYGRGAAYVRARWPQLIAAPLAIVAVIVAGWLSRDVTLDRMPAVVLLDDALAVVGAQLRFSSYGAAGPVALALLLQVTTLSVGWHYAKQAFGAVMVQSHYESFRFSSWERRAVRVHLLSVWWLSWLGQNALGWGSTLPVRSLGLPGVVVTAGLVIAAVTGAALVAAIAVSSKRNGKIAWAPALHAGVLWTWLVPFYDAPLFTSYIATFHSLQYLPFVYKAEKRRALWVPAALVVAGALAFRGVPGALDNAFDSVHLFGAHYFAVAIVAAINLHHYFIDNVIWRFDDAEVRDRLLARTPS